MFCKSCGASLAENTAVCSKCGTRFFDDTLATDNVSREEIIEHLEHAAQLKKTLYTYKKLHYKLQKKIDSLGCYKEAPEFSNAGKIVMALIVVVLICYGLVLFKIATHGTQGILIAAVIAIIFLPIVLKTISVFIKGIKTKRKITAFKAADEQRVSQEKLIARHLRPQLEQISAHINTTEDLINRVYALNIICPEYRQTEAVFAILEYLKDGKCTQLTGKNGAYSLYSSNKKKNVVISKTDCIVSQEEQQNEVSATLCAAQAEADSEVECILEQYEEILSSNNQTAQNTKLIAYNAQVKALNASILDYLEAKKSVQ